MGYSFEERKEKLSHLFNPFKSFDRRGSPFRKLITLQTVTQRASQSYDYFLVYTHRKQKRRR